MDVKNAKFIKTAVNAADFPILKDASGHLLPEVAVVGRSNVGKSSLLNHLFQVKNLARTSSTPGKTQAINFFTSNDELAIVDLPGYGYAQVPKAVREQWGPIIEGYLMSRQALKVILFLLDIRRTPNQDDLSLLNWLSHYQKKIILILTKADKLNQSERVHQSRIVLNKLHVHHLPHVVYSTTKNLGRKELKAILQKILKESHATD